MLTKRTAEAARTAARPAPAKATRAAQSSEAEAEEDDDLVVDEDEDLQSRIDALAGTVHVEWPYD